MNASSSRRAPFRSSTSELARLLAADHRRIDQLFDDVLIAFRGGAHGSAGARWRSFEYALEAHLQIEEQHILPELGLLDRDEANTLRTEHDGLRRRLRAMGRGIQLCLTNPMAVDGLIRALRAHARCADTVLYRWTITRLPFETEHGLVQHLRGADTAARRVS